MSTPPGRLLTTKEVAVYLGVSERQVERWRADGRGPDYLKLGRSIRYHPARVTAYLHERQQGK